MTLTLITGYEKENVAVDIDDTIFDFINPFFRWYNGIHKTNFRKQDAKGAPLEEILHISFNELQHEFNSFYETHDFLRLPLVPHSDEALKSLRNKYNIPIVTTRPQHIKEKTRHQLSLYLDGTVQGISFVLKKDKADRYMEINPVAVIDDDLRHISRIPEHGPKVFLVDQPWNQAKKLPKNFYRVGNWKKSTSPWPEILERLG